MATRPAILLASLLAFSLNHHEASSFQTSGNFVVVQNKNNDNTNRFGGGQTTKLDMESLSFATLDTFYATEPYVAAFLTCAFKASAADALAQSKSPDNLSSSSSSTTADEGNTKKIESQHQPMMSRRQELERNEIDDDDHPHFHFYRNLAFLLYGGFYQGMGQTFLYSNLYPSLFGTEPSTWTVLAQASIDNFLLAPFFCLPVVYTMKGILEGGNLTSGLEKYRDHIFSQQILIKYWSLWFPVQCFNFAVVPEHLRVPFGAIISFFWVCMLSSISSKETTTAVAVVDSIAEINAPKTPRAGSNSTSAEYHHLPFATTRV